MSRPGQSSGGPPGESSGGLSGESSGEAPGLSVADLPMFFDQDHAELATGLACARDALVRVEAESASDERDAAVARAMGDIGLYRWLLPRSAGTAEGPGSADNMLSGPTPLVPPPATDVVDVRALCLIREFLGYISPLADAIFAVQGLGSFPIFLAGAEQSPDRVAASGLAQLLRACRAGTSIGAFALTEPEAGSDVASMRTVAEPISGAPGQYRLHGEKTLISNVGIASHYVVFGNADPDAGHKGICAFLVHAGSDGLREQPIELNLAHPIGRLYFDGCPATLLGQPGAGFRLALQTLDTFRVTVGAAAVGMARRALDEALAHTRTRVQFGAPLADNQVVQSMLADMATELDAARLLVLRAAHEKDVAIRAGREREQRTVLGRHAAMAKLYATEAAQRIIDNAVQLHGGRGVTAGAVVENLYRAIRPLRIYEGTSEIQRLIIGRGLTR